MRLTTCIVLLFICLAVAGCNSEDAISDGTDDQKVVVPVSQKNDKFLCPIINAKLKVTEDRFILTVKAEIGSNGACGFHSYSFLKNKNNDYEVKVYGIMAEGSYGQPTTMAFVDKQLILLGVDKPKTGQKIIIYSPDGNHKTFTITAPNSGEIKYYRSKYFKPCLEKEYKERF